MSANEIIDSKMKELSEKITNTGVIVFDETKPRPKTKKKINKAEIRRLMKEIRKTLVYAE